MNRTLRRPMFRIGGSAGTGITSGLDQPRKQYQEGTPNPYASNLMPGTLPGFLTSFGLDLLSRPPQGGFFQTVAASAKGPFETFQAAEMARAQQQGERDFLRGERIAGDEAAMERLETKLASDERLAGMKTNDALYNVMLEQFIENDLPPQVAERAALFSTEKADDLRAAVTGTRYGGVLQFDIRDPSNQNLVKKNLGGKVVYDPFEDNYKYILVRNGEVYFDEFDSIADIKFPEIGTGITEQKKRKPAPDIFSPDIDDVSGA